MPVNVKATASMKLPNVLFYVSLLDLRCIRLFLREMPMAVQLASKYYVNF